MSDIRPTITVLGASGLIGSSLVEELTREGFPVVAFARRFTPAQVASFGEGAITRPFAGFSSDALADMLRACTADVIVNCLGVLQDGPRGSTAEVHEAFVARLVEAIRMQPRPVLLVHVSVPGSDEEDATAFSRTKQAGERLVATSGLPHVVLRPGFVIAPAAYGGSALVRALAALPFALPAELGNRPFATVAADDIARTVSAVAQRFAAGERSWAAAWDLCGREAPTVAAVVAAFRTRFGGPTLRLRLPMWLLLVGARTGDAVARLGWSPPVRTTALREMRRGVEGNPEAWITATGIAPAPLLQALGRVPTTVQERWFARLFLLKPMILATLALFWIMTGLIALTVAFVPASTVLAAHGFPPGIASVVTAVSSLVDIAIGSAIAVRWSCRMGLLAGIAVSSFYIASATIFTPEMWLDPLGSLMKIGPAIVLMTAGLAILEER